MKIIIAVDKFKGCATQEQLSSVIAHTIRCHMPQAQVVQVPVADGGDGTMQVIARLLKGRVEERHIEVPAPLRNLPPVDAVYLLDNDSATAYMDLATASGLALVPIGERDVMHASTLGTGLMISDAIDHGARHIVLGLGGSATCDGGMGVLAALGCEFLDKDLHQLYPCGKNLLSVEHVDIQALKTKDVRFTLLADVDNPLYGNRGAARIYAPQKGASPNQVEALDDGLEHFAGFMPTGMAQKPGAGAAGGVAGGMMAFLDARIMPGVDALLELMHFDGILDGAQLVITGEGRIDEQTGMGKAPAGVLRAAKRNGVPVVALCGSVASGVDAAVLGFSKIIPVTPSDMPLAQAMETATALKNVEIAVATLIDELIKES